MESREATEQHVLRFFAGHAVESKQWLAGPGRQALPHLRVLEIAPGPKLDKWIYVTTGAAEPGLRTLEFLAIGDQPRDTYVELLTMVAFYAIEHRLGWGHTIPIGRPLVEGSACEYTYLSLPYLFGPDLEVVPLDEGKHQILWLFPITESEKRLLLREGVDALEDRFESQSVEYWSPFRKAVA
jgi:hypothetical protein